MRVLVIIPAYNEEKSVANVIRKITAKPGIDVLVINDGSSDLTARVASSAGAKVVNLPFNLGIGGAVQTGYIYAHKKHYDIAVQVDADGQHDPEDLESIIEPVARGEVDMVVGSRYVETTNYKSSLTRRIGMIIFATVVSFINGEPIKDTTSGYRAVNKKVIAFFEENYPSDYPEVEVLILLKKAGFQIKEIPVIMSERSHGTSSITPLRSIYYMLKVLLAIFMNVIREHKGGPNQL